MQTGKPGLFGQRFDGRQQLADHAVGHGDDITITVIRQHLRVNPRYHQRNVRLQRKQATGVDHQAAHIAGFFRIAGRGFATGDEERQLGL
ncbi:hypothetical protein D3C71_1745060 [compost metagenome]